MSLYFNDFLHNIKENIKNVIFLYGEDDFNKDRIIKKVEKFLSNNGENEIDIANMYGDNNDAVSVLEELETLPFFSDKKLVILKNFDKISKDVVCISEYIEKGLAGKIYLVLIADKIDKRKKIYSKILKKFRFRDLQQTVFGKRYSKFFEARTKKQKDFDEK